MCRIVYPLSLKVLNLCIKTNLCTAFTFTPFLILVWKKKTTKTTKMLRRPRCHLQSLEY